MLAFGDSITHAGGEVQWGVALHSWALWTARALGLPYSVYAADGALAGDVAALQIPAFEVRSAHPGARYELGCLYVGTNDVRQPGWEPAELAAALDAALGFLASRCDRLLTLTIPRDMGRPRSVAKVEEANLEIESAAGRHGALVVDLRRFGGRQLMMADHVHPTAFGQIAIAEAALNVLAADGMAVKVRPGNLVVYETTRWGRLHGDLVYAYRHLKVSAKARWGRSRWAGALGRGRRLVAARVRGRMRAGDEHAVADNVPGRAGSLSV